MMTGFDILCKLSPQETICMKFRMLFSDKKIKISSFENFTHMTFYYELFAYNSDNSLYNLPSNVT